MSTDRWDELERLAQSGDRERMVERCVALEESERRAVSRRAAKLARELFSGWPLNARASVREQWTDKWRTAELLAFGTAGPVAAASLVRVGFEEQDLEPLVRSRPREWRDKWVSTVLDRGDDWSRPWRLVHRLVREGAAAKPSGDSYVTGALFGLRERFGNEPTGRRLTEVLKDEPGFLATDLWRLFEIEGRGDRNLSNSDVAWGDDDTWTEALIALSAQGVLPRERLLDESLAALRRDFTPSCARWFQRFHEAVEPTPEERAARQSDYLALLGASDPAAVGFAVRSLSKLARAKRLDEEALFEHLAPALLTHTKTAALGGVKLGARVLKARPDLARIGLPVLGEALVHESRDVQEAAVDVLERHAAELDDAVRERLGELIELVDPALRARLGALAGKRIEAPAAPAEAVPVPGSVPLAPDRPRLAGLEPLDPIATTDELADRLAVAIERGDDPDELELLLDAVSRMCDRGAEPGRAEALKARVDATLGAWWGGKIELVSAQLFATLLCDCWLHGRRARKLASSGRLPGEALRQRLEAVLADIRAHRPRPRLATPTHPGGWIDPRVAVERLAELGEKPNPLDLAQAVLRLAPDGAAEALAAAAPLRGEAAAVLRHALGGEGERKPLLSRLGPAWEGAAQRRDPAAAPVPEIDFRRSPGAWWSEYFAERRRNPAVPAVSPATLIATGSVHSWGERTLLERWLATVFPANRDQLYALGVNRLADHGEQVCHGTDDMIAPMLDPNEPVGETGALLIAAGIGASQADIRAIATDALIAAIGSRRLDGHELGGALARVLSEHERAVPGRWPAQLEDAASVGPLHAHHVQVATEAVLAVARDEDRRRLLGLIDLVRRLAVEADARVANEAARAFLERIPAKSKTGRAAREALAVNGSGAGRSVVAAA